MSNPQAAKNFELFQAFIEERYEQDDFEDYVLPDKSELNKKMVARECGFDRKRITENSKIRSLWDKVNVDLMKKGLLTEDKRTPTERYNSANASISSTIDKKQLKKQQETNAALAEELSRTKAELEQVKIKLERLKAIEEYMLITGRL